MAALAAFAFLSPAAISADLSQAVVRQKVNVVTVAASINASAQPVSQGAVVRDENVVRTGTESRAELEFGDLTLARLGANSIFTFDAEARAMNCMQGAALFSKPTNSGRVEVRAGAITAAITGSTGFVSNQPSATAKKARGASSREERTAMMGMLEGKLRGSAVWRDNNGKERTFRFALGAGEMIVAQPGRAPVVVQFDIPRFLSTSPLITGFSGTLPNMNQINRTVAEYQADERRGFIQRTNVMVSSQPVQVAWLNSSSVNRNSFDASVDQLGHSGSRPGGEEAGFVDVGGTGVIRGQLVWNTSADLDLHLILPDNQEVFFANQRVTFNNGRATAELDVDNLGDDINVPPSMRVENIVVNGVPLNGLYTFFVNNFSASNGSDQFTLRISGNGTTQTLTGTLSQGQNSQT
ncbi:MAG: FecR domain-containing protein [Chthoniobacterales bacterium]|nr:FecR domain-containing protein [Chthoniobacterales bacterium]